MANNETFEKKFSSLAILLVNLVKDLRGDMPLAEVAFKRNSSKLKFIFC
jgi:hypothetical protein